MEIRSSIRALAVATGTFSLLLSPAHATGTNINTVPSPAGNVTGLCTYVEDLPDQSFNNMTIVIKFEVSADAPAWAVNGVCTIKDINNKVYGSVTAGAPGVFAANADRIVVPRNIVGAKACNTPEALWLNGTEANPTNRTTCTPL